VGEFSLMDFQTINSRIALDDAVAQQARVLAVAPVAEVKGRSRLYECIVLAPNVFHTYLCTLPQPQVTPTAAGSL
jgi:hypothetical protein